MGTADPVQRPWAVLPSVAVVAVAALGVAAADPSPGWSRAVAGLLGGLLSGLLILAVTVPFALMAPRHRRALGMAALFVLLSAVATGLPRTEWFAGFQWNWQGKIIDLLWVCALFAVLRAWAWQEAGLRPGLTPGAAGPVAAVVGLIAASWFGLTLLGLWAGAPDPPMNTERLLFDTTIPNLTEELIWRGAMLAVLDRALGTPWRLGGTHVGWGLVLTAVAFGVGHGLVVSTTAGVRFLPVDLVLGVLAGTVFGWLRARSGSIWPPFAAHCLMELGVQAAVIVH